MAIVISFLLVLAAGIFLLFVIYATVVGHFKGAPFVKSGKGNIKVMLELAEIKVGEKVIDLGSGDGTLCIEAAKAGAIAVGIEFNPFLVLLSRWKARKAGLSDNVHIIRTDFRRYPLSDASVVFLYLWPETIDLLKEKLARELKPGSRIVSNSFPIKGWTSVVERERVYLYPVRTPSTPIGGFNKQSLLEFTAPVGRTRSSRSNGVYHS